MPRISIKALRKCVANNTVSFTGTSDVDAEKRKDHVIVDTTGVDVNTNKSKKRKAGEMNLDGNGTGGSTGTTNSTKNATSELSKPSAIELHDKGDFNNDRTIYMEGLPFTSNEDEVKSVFASCGKILQIRLPRWHDSTRLLGYGHILFSNASAAKKALELDGKCALFFIRGI
jgi:nucleolin